jgi:hypothetical protein
MKIVPLVGAIVLATVGFLAWGDARYVTRSEWVHAEAAEAKSVASTAAELSQHVSDTRLDATRLGVIEVQLKTIERQLDVIATKLDRAASREKAR